MADHIRDDDGRPPQHTFFFPEDEYRPEYLDALKPLCEAGFGDVDVHLHHDNDTAASLEDKLAGFRDTLYHRHGLLQTVHRGVEVGLQLSVVGRERRLDAEGQVAL